MVAEYVPQQEWEEAFFTALAKFRNIRRSAIAAGVTTGAIYSRRNKSPGFKAALQRVLSQGGKGKPGVRPRPAVSNHWKPAFLHALAETSNVSQSARHARISAREAYKARREDEGFARAWHAALVEGYEHLEMELLARLRSGEPKDGPRHDNGAALRLLALHRDTMACEHAQRRNLDAASARALIEQKLDELRLRVLSRRDAEGGTVQ